MTTYLCSVSVSDRDAKHTVCWLTSSWTYSITALMPKLHASAVVMVGLLDHSVPTLEFLAVCSLSSRTLQLDEGPTSSFDLFQQLSKWLVDFG